MLKIYLLAVVLVVLIGGAAMAGSLSGSWVTTAKILPQTFSMSSFSSTLTVDYTVGTWTFRSLSQVDLSGWKSQVFSATGTIGAVSASSHLALDPQSAAFSYWNTSTTVTIAGVSLTGISNLTSTGIGWTIGAKGSLDNVTLQATAYFNENSSGEVQTGYALCFSRAVFDVQFPFGCVDPVDISVGFSTTDGFDGLTVNLNDIVWDQFPTIAFDIKIEFSLQTEGKVLTITPTLNFPSDGCIILYGEILTGTSVLQITGIHIYGVSLQYSWNGTSFATYSSFDPDKNSSVTGKSDYWEKFSIESAGDSCCGGGIQFDIDTYFESGSVALFDWGETDLTLTLGVGSNITVTAGTVFTAQNGFEELSAGLELNW